MPLCINWISDAMEKLVDQTDSTDMKSLISPRMNWSTERRGQTRNTFPLSCIKGMTRESSALYYLKGSGKSAVSIEYDGAGGAERQRSRPQEHDLGSAGQEALSSSGANHWLPPRTQLIPPSTAKYCFLQESSPGRCRVRGCSWLVRQVLARFGLPCLAATLKCAGLGAESPLSLQHHSFKEARSNSVWLACGGKCAAVTSCYKLSQDSGLVTKCLHHKLLMYILELRPFCVLFQSLYSWLVSVS